MYHSLMVLTMDFVSYDEPQFIRAVSTPPSNHGLDRDLNHDLNSTYSACEDTMRLLVTSRDFDEYRDKQPVAFY